MTGTLRLGVPEISKSSEQSIKQSKPSVKRRKVNVYFCCRVRDYWRMQRSPDVPVTLQSSLAEWSRADPQRGAVAETVIKIAQTSAGQAADLYGAFMRGDYAESRSQNADGDVQRRIDLDAHDLYVTAMESVSVAAVASEESEDVVFLAPDGKLLVAIDPLDGSANLAVDAPLGVIFSIRPAAAGREAQVSDFLVPGEIQLAAGLVLFGAVTLLALTVGDGTDVYAFDVANGEFRLVNRRIVTPQGTREFAINLSNNRHWTPAMRTYIADLLEGADGPRGANFNMRWYGALVGDAYRVLTRGGVYLYPEDDRPGYERGRLRLVYEAQAVAMLIEQAGGAATDGRRRILEIPADRLHSRVPLIFGSADKVARIGDRISASDTNVDQAPLFGSRGLFREGKVSR